MSLSRREFTRNSALVGAGFIMGLMPNGCTSAKPKERPNFLWIIAEDISPFFGCYGDEDGHTPHIDEYAQKSHLFKRAYSTAPICAPSRSCLATGMYATSLGTQNLRSDVKLPDRIKPLPSILKQNGYWVSMRGKTDYNFSADGIFDYWKEDIAPWRQCPEDKPFYSYVNLGSTHEGSGNRSERANPALKRLDPTLKHDPAKTALPPYYPDTPEMRRIWARYYDLITVWDYDVNKVLEQLKADGRAEDTIVFLMADHGMGVPRYKRWLYLTGINVPLIVHVPEKFKNLVKGKRTSSVRDDIVSYVDLPATVLKMAGVKIPDNFQGQSIFSGKKRDYIFGARDRADDMYDLSRAVFDGRYLYIRHFMPHHIPMPEGMIIGPYKKESHLELYRVRDVGQASKEVLKLWSPRPFEELYDIQNDPQELNNIAENAVVTSIKNDLAAKLQKWILDTRDSGFLTEPDMHRRAIETNTKVYDILQNDSTYPIANILNAAEQASLPDSDLLPAGDDPMETYWAIQQRIIRKHSSAETVEFLKKQLSHKNPTVRATAAEALAKIGYTDLALPVFEQLLSETEPNLLLYISRTLAVSTDNVRPIEKTVRAARQRMMAPAGSPRPWKDFNYSAFTCWALEWALVKSGLNTPKDFGWI